MIKIFAKMTVKEENLNEFLTVAAELVSKSAAEDGNLFYSMNRSTEDPETFAFFECWKDEDALEIHRNTEHSIVLFPKLEALCVDGVHGEYFSELFSK